jgi:alpha-glucosidase
VYDKSRPENLAFLQRLRALVDRYPDTSMVGEIGDDDGLARVAEYTAGGDKLHMAYCFDLLGPKHDAPFLHATFARFTQVVGSGWPCWAITNHDIPRVATRWGGNAPSGPSTGLRTGLLRAAAAVQLTARGSACIYQGDELGLPEADIAFEDLQDPYGIAMWPEFKGRDGCRTPMPWSATEPNLAFSAGTPWLPVAAAHATLAADRQEADNTSLLHFYRRLLEWRRTQPALLHGEMDLLAVHPQVLAWVRTHAGERLLCAFNMSDTPADYTPGSGAKVAQVLTQSGLEGGRADGAALQFAPWGALIARLA